ncbi:MAG: leucine-rich repeat domain-containing protein, partial [Clostridia bacterium]|nr:leucine-rich repeat domain-containing protein [Clostridia bacterium]
VFSYCAKLTSLFIPASVNEIHSKSLSLGSSFERLEVDGANVKYFSEGNCIIERNTNKLIAGCKTSVVPSYVTEIGDSAFAMTSELKRIALPQGVVKIGKEAFLKCYNLEEIRIPSSVTQIGEKAFEECNFRRARLICEFAKKPEGWADDIGVNKKNIVWTVKQGILGRLKSIFK